MVTERLFRQVDGRPLFRFRVLFGALMFVSILRFWAKGWIQAQYLAPEFHFHYFGFSWVRVWPEWAMYLHFSLIALSALLVSIGIWYRFSIISFFLLFTYVELMDVTYYLNHYYLISLLAGLMIFMPLGARDDRRVPAWCLYALRAQVGLVYFFAGVAKLKHDWLFEAEPLGTWLRSHGDLPWIGHWLAQRWIAYAASWSGAAFDLAVVPLLLHSRTRPFAYGVLVIFHLLTAALFQLGMFPWVMILSALIFFPPRSPLPSLAGTRSRFAPALLTALSIYFAVQVALPLRHFLYPGKVTWSEQGFRFAWHVMLTEKSGYIRFEVKDPRSGQTWDVYPTAALTRQQRKMMSTQPDLILQWAHKLRTDFSARLGTTPQIYVDCWVAMNGHPSARLIDPRVDLAQVEDGLAPKSWILPHPN